MVYFVLALILCAACIYLARSIRSRHAIANINRGRLFLEANGKHEGVISCESGLQYQILHEGDSDKRPAATDRVTVHYEGKLLDGRIFDSSIEREQAASFALNQVIAGWTEGLQYLNEGSKARLFIPSRLGYGHRNIGTIPAGSLLIFDIELIKVH